VPSSIDVVDAATNDRHSSGSDDRQISCELELAGARARVQRDVLGHVERLETQLVGVPGDRLQVPGSLPTTPELHIRPIGVAGRSGGAVGERRDGEVPR